MERYGDGTLRNNTVLRSARGKYMVQSREAETLLKQEIDEI